MGEKEHSTDQQRAKGAQHSNESSGQLSEHQRASTQKGHSDDRQLRPAQKDQNKSSIQQNEHRVRKTLEVKARTSINI